MPIKYAKCCKPNEGGHSSVIGIINRMGLVMVHRKKCGNLRNANPERQVKASWK